MCLFVLLSMHDHFPLQPSSAASHGLSRSSTGTLASSCCVQLHKFTDDLANADKDAGAARRLANFEALLARQPHAAVIDPLQGANEA